MGGFLQQLADGRARALRQPAVARRTGFRQRNLQLVIHFCLDFMAVGTLVVSHGCSIEFVEPAYLFRSRRKTVCSRTASVRLVERGSAQNSSRLYHVPVHELAERVLGDIRREELLRAGDRVGIAVSGGIDSVALLRLLLELRSELGIVLCVVHFNHKLRGAESKADQEFVAGLAREYGLEFYAACGDATQLAAEQRSGL